MARIFEEILAARGGDQIVERLGGPERAEHRHGADLGDGDVGQRSAQLGSLDLLQGDVIAAGVDRRHLNVRVRLVEVGDEAVDHLG